MSSISGNDLTMQGDGSYFTQEPPTARRVHFMTEELVRGSETRPSRPLNDDESSFIYSIQVLVEIGMHIHHSIDRGTALSVRDDQERNLDPIVIRTESAILSEDFIKVKNLVEQRFQGHDVVGEGNRPSLSYTNTVRDLSELAEAFERHSGPPRSNFREI